MVPVGLYFISSHSEYTCECGNATSYLHIDLFSLRQTWCWITNTNRRYCQPDVCLNCANNGGMSGQWIGMPYAPQEGANVAFLSYILLYARNTMLASYWLPWVISSDHSTSNLICQMNPQSIKCKSRIKYGLRQLFYQCLFWSLVSIETRPI